MGVYNETELFPVLSGSLIFLPNSSASLLFFSVLLGGIDAQIVMYISVCLNVEILMLYRYRAVRKSTVSPLGDCVILAVRLGFSY